MARLKITLVLASGARIGPGKAKLLESIRDTGSISAAAREMGMSYKRAWLLLDSLNAAFEPAVVTTSLGGPGGGGARLTDVLERMISGRTKTSELERLLPWTWKAERLTSDVHV
jgi:molybdate transport system regulatory protein